MIKNPSLIEGSDEGSDKIEAQKGRMKEAIIALLVGNEPIATEELNARRLRLGKMLDDQLLRQSFCFGLKN